MTALQAKHILLAYRPWAQDAEDPEVAEALALCRADPVLAKWLAEHCTMQNMLRAKFQGIKAPEGLVQQIVSERPSSIAILPRLRRQSVAVLACVAIVISVWSLWLSMPRFQREDLSFNGYRNRIVRTASRAYGMDFETNSVSAIRDYLAANQYPVEGEIPAALAQTPTVGCGLLSWQNGPVTMVCYKTGQPLPPGAKSDLMLFVINERDVQGVAKLTETQFSKVSDMYTASWKAGDKIYLLAAFNEAELLKRL